MRGNFIPLANIYELNSDEYICFAFYNGELLIKFSNNKSFIPLWEDIKKLDFIQVNCIGELNLIKCFALELKFNENLPKGMEFVKLRQCGMILNEDIFQVAGRASQLLSFERNNIFCGKCGERLQNKEAERAKVCKICDLTIYPTISPAIIVAITKGDKILLAHNRTFENNKYSVLAGFLESGESLEECTKREVFEEVGIAIKNIKYFNSQSWPFPNSLMIGFFAEYDGGNIQVDGIEIDNANWFSKDNLPNIPEKNTIAGKMIDSFINTY